MSKITTTEDAAIKDLESIFLFSGYIDFADLNFGTRAQIDENIVNATSPIFYRLTTPASAPTASIAREGEPRRAVLYLLYSSIASSGYSALNKTVGTAQAFTVTLFYDQEYLFWRPTEGEPTNNFLPYLDNLINGFEDGLWVVEDMGETAFEATEGSNIFNYRKMYRVEKNFF